MSKTPRPLTSVQAQNYNLVNHSPQMITRRKTLVSSFDMPNSPQVINNDNKPVSININQNNGLIG